MADQEITCSDCWPKICRCHKGPLPKAYIEWAGAGFWFEGTVMRRNKLDASGKHPWKAEVDENDTGVEQSIINGWYTRTNNYLYE